jgi:hypothetical protein
MGTYLAHLASGRDQRVFQYDRKYSTSVCQNTISDRKAASISVANII